MSASDPDPSLEGAWEAYRGRHYLLEPAYNVRAYRNVFSHGYLATTDHGRQAPVQGWHRAQVGHWNVFHDPAVRVTTAGGQDPEPPTVLIIGDVFDDDQDGGADDIAARIAGLGLAEGVSGARQVEAIDEYVTWLSGRFVVFCWHGDELFVWPDPMASRLCYWVRAAGIEVIASHTALVSDFVGGLSSEGRHWVMRHPNYSSPQGRWLPGLIQPHDEVNQVFANCRLRWGTAGVSHERFFPTCDAGERAVNDAYEIFRDSLRRQVEHWTSARPLTMLALTGGADSRAVLTAGMASLTQGRSMALTYHFFRSGNVNTYADYAHASRLALSAGLPHLLLDIRDISSRSQFSQLYQSTFPTWTRFAKLAGALYVSAPARASLMLGVGGGIGTVTLQDRSEQECNPAVLARKYAQCSFADDTDLHTEMERWMSYAQFDVPALRGYDFRDMFHWEHRLSKWAAFGYSEYDLAITPALPFNSRKVILSMLELPEQDRRDKTLYQRLEIDSGVTP